MVIHDPTLKTMLSYSLRLIVLCLTLLSVCSAVEAQEANARKYRETFVIKAMRTLHGAQMTYNATYGNGTFTTLDELHSLGFIDSALASGRKYGYVFTVEPIPPGELPYHSFRINAAPVMYRKTGKRSFYLAIDGVLRGADHRGKPAGPSDPEIDYSESNCFRGNELCTIMTLRTLHGAELTYSATKGVGNFGTMEMLFQHGLIDRHIATGQVYGYRFDIEISPYTKSQPAAFRIFATPITYGETGIRSFFIDTTGVIRAADRQGKPAGPDDPPLK